MSKSLIKFPAESNLRPTGARILADRYLLGEVRSQYDPGDLVVVNSGDPKTGHFVALVDAVSGVHLTVRDNNGDVHEINESDVIKTLLEDSAEQMWDRLSGNLAKNEKQRVQFRGLLDNFRYMPGGRINAAIGSGADVTAYNCFVIPTVGPAPRDLANSFKQTLEIQARSGGVGTNLSGVAPKGTYVSSLSKLGNRKRMNIVMHVWHPDIREFVEADLPNANKIVVVNDEFMNAAGNNDKYHLVYPDTREFGHDMWDVLADGISARRVHKIRHVQASHLLDELMGNDNITIVNESELDILWKKSTPLVVHDSRANIADKVGDMWDLMMDNKHVSVILSGLRHRRSKVFSVRGVSSGASGWARLYDKANEVFGYGFGVQGAAEIISIGSQLTMQAGSRKGAIMLVLSDRHADLLDFMTMKRKSGVVEGANVSVLVSDKLMANKAVDSDWHLGYSPEAHEGNLHQFRDFHDDEIRSTVSSKWLWDTLIESAWGSAEPGVIFIDKYQYMSNSWYYNSIVATNPCGEQGLPPYGVCNLGAIVLAKFVEGFVINPTYFTVKSESKEKYIRSLLLEHFDLEKANYFLSRINWDELEFASRTGVRFQDAVIDNTFYPFEEIKKNQLSERRVGLGIMGLHDLLLKVGVQYGSDESVALTDVVMGLIAEWAYLESVDLAKENGPFEQFVLDKYLQSGFMQNMAAKKPHVVREIKKYGIRNSTVLTIAPTGTTGSLIGCSTGCEPYFAWSYVRNSNIGRMMENVQLLDEFKEAGGDVDNLPRYFTTAMQMTPEDHIKIQGALQVWIDSSISKTCNAPHDYSIDQTERLYSLAYELGCKGVTIYRDASRDTQVLEVVTGTAEPKKDDKVEENNLLGGEACSLKIIDGQLVKSCSE